MRVRRPKIAHHHAIVQQIWPNLKAGGEGSRKWTTSKRMNRSQKSRLTLPLYKPRKKKK